MHSEKADLPAGCYVMGLTPFKSDGAVDEAALREHVQWMARENVGFWPASPASGEGSLMADAELFRVWDIVVEEMAGRIPVVAGSREFPTAKECIDFARQAKGLGVDAIQLYPPTMGHSFVPTKQMLERFYDDVLSAVDMPVILSSNLTTGFEVPAEMFDRPVDDSHVIGIFKHHSDQHNVSEFVARFGSRTTVLTMSQRLMFSYAVGARGELDHLQNIAPRLCRRLHDALFGNDLVAANEAYAGIVELWSAIVAFSGQFAVPRVAAYKAVLRILGIGGGHTRPPYMEPSDEAMVALRRTLDRLELREREGLV